MQKMMVNISGGPGSGKSTIAAQLFAMMKWAGYRVEFVPEYAKDIVWEKAYHKLDDQLDIFHEQRRRLMRCWKHEQLDVVITDSPILLSMVYGKRANMSEYFFKMVEESHDAMCPCINVFLDRTKKYHTGGRVQNEERANQLSREILAMYDKVLGSNGYHRMLATPDSAQAILDLVETIAPKLKESEVK